MTLQETALAQSRLLLPPLEKALGQQRNLLAVLTGHFPSETHVATFGLGEFKLPRTLPLSVPADLVRQRPDILIAESTVRAVNAQVGVAIANRLPQIKISGNAGSAASALTKMFSSGTGFWLIAADVVQPLFDGYSLHYKQKAAEHQLRQAMGAVSQRRPRGVPERRRCAVGTASRCEGAHGSGGGGALRDP